MVEGLHPGLHPLDDDDIGVGAPVERLSEVGVIWSVLPCLGPFDTVEFEHNEAPRRPVSLNDLRRAAAGQVFAAVSLDDRPPLLEKAAEEDGLICHFRIDDHVCCQFPRSCDKWRYGCCIRFGATPALHPIEARAGRRRRTARRAPQRHQPVLRQRPEHPGRELLQGNASKAFQLCLHSLCADAFSPTFAQGGLETGVRASNIGGVPVVVKGAAGQWSGSLLPIRLRVAEDGSVDARTPPQVTTHLVGGKKMRLYEVRERTPWTPTTGVPCERWSRPRVDEETGPSWASTTRSNASSRRVHDAMLDDARWPVTSTLIDEACGLTGNDLIVHEGPLGRRPGALRRGLPRAGSDARTRERDYLVENYYPTDERVPRFRLLPDSHLVHVRGPADGRRAEDLAHLQRHAAPDRRPGQPERPPRRTGRLLHHLGTSRPRRRGRLGARRGSRWSRICCPHIRQFVRFRQALVRGLLLPDDEHVVVPECSQAAVEPRPVVAVAGGQVVVEIDLVDAERAGERCECPAAVVFGALRPAVRAVADGPAGTRTTSGPRARTAATSSTTARRSASPCHEANEQAAGAA